MQPINELLADRNGGRLFYQLDGNRIYVLHTEVHPFYRGEGTGRDLIRAAVDVARNAGLVIVPWCPFARRWLREHPNAAEGVSIDWTIPAPASR